MNKKRDLTARATRRAFYTRDWMRLKSAKLKNFSWQKWGDYITTQLVINKTLTAADFTKRGNLICVGQRFVHKAQFIFLMFLENKTKMYKCHFRETFVYHLLQICAFLTFMMQFYIIRDIYAVHRHTDKSNDYYKRSHACARVLKWLKLSLQVTRDVLF